MLNDRVHVIMFAQVASGNDKTNPFNNYRVNVFFYAINLDKTLLVVDYLSDFDKFNCKNFLSY